MSWKPDNGTRIGIVPRGGSNDDVRWFETDNCYVVHFFNAWESGEHDRDPGAADGGHARRIPVREPGCRT